MSSLIYYGFVYFVEALIIWLYCSQIFDSKHSHLSELLSCIGFYFIAFLLSLYENLWINLGVFCTINFLYIFMFFKSNWYTSLFHATISTAVMSLTEFLTSTIFTELSYTFYQDALWHNNLSILAIFSKFLYFISLQLLVLAFGKTKSTSNPLSIESILLTFIPLITTVIMGTFGIINLSIDINSSIGILTGISSLLLLFCNIIVFGLYNYTQKKNQLFTELQLQSQKEYDLSEYYQMLLNQQENQRILIHDIKKHLNSIAHLNQCHKHDKIECYIQEIMSSSDLQINLRVSDNDLLNAIMSRYIKLCQTKQIDFRIDIRKHSLDFIQSKDITALICNLMDNAYDSASLQEQSFIDLHISQKEGTPFTLLTLVNSCRVNPFVDSYGTLVTRKKDKMRHGYGVKSIKRVVAAYGGEIEMYYDKETLTFHTVLTLRNQPD